MVVKSEQRNVVPQSGGITLRELTLEAPAKINLTLDILGKRPDGYHDLQMVMQSISLCDTVKITVEAGGGKISVSAQGTDLPDGPENLAWKAAKSLSVGIHLKKRIPIQAGMAGGSADAAAVLRGLRRLCCPEMPEEELERVGAAVGSDVPFCVRCGTALAEGRGERLTSLDPMPHCWIVVCKPEFGLSTPALFGRIRVQELQKRPDNAGMRAALHAENLAGIAGKLGNVFEQVLLPRERREIFAIEKALRRCGALNAIMTGSGPAVFGLFSQKTDAQKAAEMLRAGWNWVYLAEPL